MRAQKRGTDGGGDGAGAGIPELEAAIADEDETIKLVEAMALGKQKLDPRFPDTGAALQELRDMEVRKKSDSVVWQRGDDLKSSPPPTPPRAA